MIFLTNCKLRKIKQKPLVFNTFWGIGLDGNMSKSNKKCVQRRLRWRRRSYINVGIDSETKKGPKIIPKSIQNRFQNGIASDIVNDKRFDLIKSRLADRRLGGNPVLGLPGRTISKELEYRIQRTRCVVWHAMGQRPGEFCQVIFLVLQCVVFAMQLLLFAESSAFVCWI